MKLLHFTVPKGASLPSPGENVAVPVEGGREWMELGVFTEAHLNRETGGVELVLCLNPDLSDVRLEDR